jgi:hypothetical protein
VQKRPPVTKEQIEEYVRRARKAAEEQGAGRIASDEQLETIARIHASYLLEQARNGPTKKTCRKTGE